MIPNRHLLALDATERLAESSDFSRRCQFALETGNWPLLAALKAQAADAAERRRRRRNDSTIRLD